MSGAISLFVSKTFRYTINGKNRTLRPGYLIYMNAMEYEELLQHPYYESSFKHCLSEPEVLDSTYQEANNKWNDYYKNLKTCKDCLYFNKEVEYCAVNPLYLNRAEECPDYYEN